MYEPAKASQVLLESPRLEGAWYHTRLNLDFTSLAALEVSSPQIRLN